MPTCCRGAIQSQFEALCVTRFPKGTWKVDITERPAGADTKSTLLKRINEIAANMLVIGFTGRKGPKVRTHAAGADEPRQPFAAVPARRVRPPLPSPLHTRPSACCFTAPRCLQDDPTILGSSADYSLRSARMPCCIVKRKVDPRARHTYVVAVDGSERSHSGVVLAEQVARPDDRIVIVHVAVRSTTTGTCVHRQALDARLMLRVCGNVASLHCSLLALLNPCPSACLQEGTSEGTGTDAGSVAALGDHAVLERYAERARGDPRLAFRLINRTRAKTAADLLVGLADDGLGELLGADAGAGAEAGGPDVDFLVVGVDVSQCRGWMARVG